MPDLTIQDQDSGNSKMKSIPGIFVNFAELFLLIPIFFVVANPLSANVGAINVISSATAAAVYSAPLGER